MFNGLVGTFRYKAFISYSHQDRTWGAWLQRALEKYRIPGRLVGTKGAYGKIPARLSPVFRDRGNSPGPGWVSWVIENWIGDPSSGSGQLAYYSSKQLHNTSRFRRTRMLGNLCLWAGIFIAVMLFLLDSGADDEQRHMLLILMGVLPLVAGIWDAYSHKKAEKELIKQYGFMSGVFSKARKLLDESDDPVFQRRVLKALGQAALDEGAEWLLMHRERPLEHGHL